MGGHGRVGAGPVLQEARVRPFPPLASLCWCPDADAAPARSTDTPLNQETQYTPTDKDERTRNYLMANRLYSPMLALLEFLSSRFQAFRYRSAELVHASLLFFVRLVAAHKSWRCVRSPLSLSLVRARLTQSLDSRHPLSRELRFRLISFGLALIQATSLESAAEHNLRAHLYDAALGWFAMRPTCVLSLSLSLVAVVAVVAATELNWLVARAGGRSATAASSSRPTCTPSRSSIASSRSTRRTTAASPRTSMDNGRSQVRPLSLPFLRTLKRSPTRSPCRSSRSVDRGRAPPLSPAAAQGIARRRGRPPAPLAQPAQRRQARHACFGRHADRRGASTPTLSLFLSLSRERR